MKECNISKVKPTEKLREQTCFYCDINWPVPKKLSNKMEKVNINRHPFLPG